MAQPTRAEGWEFGGYAQFNKAGDEGMAWGGGIKMKYDLCDYFAADARVGYMKSDCFKVKYVPLEIAAYAQLPLWDGRLVPYAGIGGGYYIFTGATVDLEDSFGYYPLVGIQWRLGKEKKWSLALEGRLQYLEAKVLSGGDPGQNHVKFAEYGGILALSRRF